MYIEQRSRVMYGYMVMLCTSLSRISCLLTKCSAHVCTESDTIHL